MNKIIIKVLSLCVVLMLSTLGIISLVEKIDNYRSFIKRVDETALVSEDYDYSKSISNNYNIDKLMDKTDLFILENNKNLSLNDAWNLKSYIRKYTSSDDEFNMMISLYAVESNFYKNAESYLGAKYGRGLGQVSEIALTEYNWKNKTDIQPNELYDEETNIKVSCWLITHFQKTYKLDTVGTLMVYNKGYGGYNQNRSDINYSLKILTHKAKLDNV